MMVLKISSRHDILENATLSLLDIVKQKKDKLTVLK